MRTLLTLAAITAVFCRHAGFDLQQVTVDDEEPCRDKSYTIINIDVLNGLLSVPCYSVAWDRRVLLSVCLSVCALTVAIFIRFQ